MPEISFQMDQRKETLLNTHGEAKEHNLLVVTSTFLRCFYLLLKGCHNGTLPDASEIHKCFNKFLRASGHFWGKRKPVDESLFTKSTDEEVYGLSEFVSEENALAMELFTEQKPNSIIFYSLEAINSKIKDQVAASIWLECIAMYCAVYYWLAPKVVGNNKDKGEDARKESRRKPGIMFADYELLDYSRESQENKIIHAVFDLVKNPPREKEYSHILIKPEDLPICPFTQPLLAELLTGVFSYRIKTVGMDLDLRYPRLSRQVHLLEVPYDQWVKMRPDRICGVKYKTQTLLQLAWLEILHAIQFDIYVNTCEFCGKALLLKKQYSKKLCGSKKCKQKYDQQQNIFRRAREREKLFQSKSNQTVKWKSQ